MERQYDWEAMAAMHLVATALAPVLILLLVYMLYESWAAAVAAAVGVAAANVATVRVMIRKGSPVGQVYSRWMRRSPTQESLPKVPRPAVNRWPCVLAGAGVAFVAYIVLAVVLGFSVGVLVVKDVVPLSFSAAADIASVVTGLFLGILFGRWCWRRKRHGALED